MKRAITILTIVALTLSMVTSTANADMGQSVGVSTIIDEDEAVIDASAEPIVTARSAVLMDYNTGTVLYAKNAEESLPPASVTKVMTLLLIMEAVESGKIGLDEMISVSEYSAGMGGSQIFLEAGEKMRAEDMIKSIVIASANDSAVAMAEAVAGSEASFVAMMNTRAGELGMKSTCFENVTGLDDDTVNHVTSAMDIALMSRALMSHGKIFEFTTRWMDSVRDGQFGLTNTNRLIRFYNGATGLKTGSTDKAKFCISATAEREGLHLIAVIMGAESRDVRNSEAAALLDYGFANYCVYTADGGSCGEAQVKSGSAKAVEGVTEKFEALLNRGTAGGVTGEAVFDAEIKAPVRAGDKIGTYRYTLNGECIGERDITAVSDVPKIGFLEVFCRIIASYLLK